MELAIPPGVRDELDELFQDMLQLLDTVRNVVSFGAPARKWIEE